MSDGERIPVHAHGAWRGSTIAGEGAVRVTPDGILIVFGEREYVLAIERLDGFAWRPPVLSLYAAGELLELSGHAALADAGAQIAARGLVLPELTRALHGLGSRRGTPGVEHDRFFAALLRARQVAEGCVEPESRLAAFDARRLAHSMTTMIGELAAERYPESAPDRRALEAELLEYAERLFAALESLGEAADRVRTSGDEVRLAEWRAWTRAAHRVFEEADRCWIASRPVVRAAVPPPPSPRRRLWRRSGGGRR